MLQDVGRWFPISEVVRVFLKINGHPEDKWIAHFSGPIYNGMENGKPVFKLGRSVIREYSSYSATTRRHSWNSTGAYIYPEINTRITNSGAHAYIPELKGDPDDYYTIQLSADGEAQYKNDSTAGMKITRQQQAIEKYYLNQQAKHDELSGVARQQRALQNLITKAIADVGRIVELSKSASLRTKPEIDLFPATPAPSKPLFDLGPRGSTGNPWDTGLPDLGDNVLPKKGLRLKGKPREPAIDL